MGKKYLQDDYITIMAARKKNLDENLKG